jgi:diguanylate cyclase (GGDEF)-like protein/PAS domain S-box-containing protein
MKNKPARRTPKAANSMPEITPSPPTTEGRIAGMLYAAQDITERKRAEEALRDSEEHYRSLFDRVMDGLYRSTHEGKFVDVNLAMVRMFGYSSREEMLKVDIKKELYFAPDERGSHILDTGQEEMDVYRMRRKDGSEIWVEDHGSYVHDEQGRITYHEGMLRDITERKQAETLREVLLEIMQGGVTTKDLQDFLSLVHRSIDKVIYAENFFVVLYNKDADWFEEVYSVDKFDPPGPPSRDEKSISAYVIRTGRPLLLNDEQVFSELVAQGEVELVGTNSPSWMAVPLKTSKETIGVMVVQDYDAPNRYSERDLEVLASIAGQVALVVERKRAEEALAASEAELRALFASMHDAVLVIDRDGVYRKIAPTNPGLLVRPPEELLNKNLRDVFPAETAEVFRGVMQRVLDTKQNTQIEYELIIAGRTMWFQTTISPLNEDSTLWVAHDITSRKHVEEALQTAEANYRSIFENATIGVYQSTPQGRFLGVNPVMARIFGYDSPQEMLNNTTSIEKQYYVDTADRHEFQRLIMEQGEAREFISQNRRKDGVHIWVQENARAARNANGSILHYEGFITDITERKRAEEELRRAKDNLETANLELQQSLEREKLLASTDGLTSLCNRRNFFELADREFHAAVRHLRPLAFLMFDMDDFKKVNDTLGHAIGDKLLTMVAQTAAAQVRVSDVAARYGGDEFIVMLPHASAQQALPIAERIRASVAALHVDTFRDDKGPLAITLSIGIAEMRHEPMDESVERVVQRADKALYKAKQSGRNCIVIFAQDETGAT